MTRSPRSLLRLTLIPLALAGALLWPARAFAAAFDEPTAPPATEPTSTPTKEPAAPATREPAATPAQPDTPSRPTSDQPAPAADQPAPASEPTATPTNAPAKPQAKSDQSADTKPAAKPGDFTSADALLDALESAGRDIRTLSASIRYTKVFSAIEGSEKQVRTGRLYFRADPAPASNSVAAQAKPAPDLARRMFQVDFETLQVDDKFREESQIFIFDGEWLVERFPEQKQQNKRRVVAPGERIDPLAIGEGPFPIPIGQKKSKILERFTAELLAPEDGFPAPPAPAAPAPAEGADAAATPAPTPKRPAWLADSYQLKLIPKPGTEESRKFASVRLWYTKDGLLPRLAITDDKEDASTEVFLPDVQINQTLPGNAFDMSLPPGWTEQVTPYKRTEG
jgi:hypothetical protein